jgi:RNA polymerase sigma-70 factor (ECF subfamily)
MSVQELAALDDEQLIIEAGARGDGEALDLLYRQFAAPLQAFCMSRLGDREAAEDACHDALLRAHSALPRFTRGNRLWPWLATIAANVCIDIQRREGRLVPLDYREEEAEAPEYEAERRAHQTVVADAVRALPARYRSYIYWREFEGWSYEDIATFEGSSVASVRSRLMRARKVLKDQLLARAATDRQWSLPAAIPLFSQRVRSSLAAPFVRLRSRLSQGSAARLPALSGPMLALPFDVSQALGAALLSGLLFAGAVPAMAAPATTVDAAVVPAGASADTPVDLGAGSSGRGDEGGRTRPVADVVVGAPGTPAVAVASAAMVEEGQRRTLDGIVRAKVGGNGSKIDTRTEFDCTTSQVREAVCDAAEQLPPLGGD